MTIELDRYGASLTLRSPYSDDMRELCAAINGSRWDKSRGVWTYPATIGTAALVHNTLKGNGLNYAATDAVLALLEWARRAAEARKYRVAENLPDIPDSGSPFPAWQHQRQAFYYAVEQEAVALEMIMSAGKSRVVVELVNAWGCNLVLVVCPKNVSGVWPREFRTHSRTDYLVTDGRPYKRNGEVKKTASLAERVEYLDDLVHLQADTPIVVVINYDSVWREPFASWAIEHEWDAGIADEIHRAKAPGAKASKMLARLRPRCHRRIGPTGTFLPHTPLDAYGACRFLEPALFGTSFKSFCVRYGKRRVKYVERDVDFETGELRETPVYLDTPKGEPLYDGVRDDAADELAAKLSTIAYSCGEERLDLPGELDIRLDVELNAKTLKVYADLERELVAEVHDAETDSEGVVVVNNALSKLLRLQQITSGHVPVETACSVCGGHGDDVCLACDGIGFGQEVAELGDEKEQVLGDWLADIAPEQPVVTFCRFRHDLDAIARVAEKTDRAYGEISGRRKDGLNDDGELDERVRLCGVQIQSGSEGVDLTRARFAVYMSLGFSLKDYRQSRYRIRRPNSPDKTLPRTYVHLVAPGTVDEHVYEALAAREQAVEAVLAAMRRQAERVAA